MAQLMRVMLIQHKMLPDSFHIVRKFFLSEIISLKTFNQLKKLSQKTEKLMPNTELKKDATASIIIYSRVNGSIKINVCGKFKKTSLKKAIVFLIKEAEKDGVYFGKDNEQNKGWNRLVFGEKSKLLIVDARLAGLKPKEIAVKFQVHEDFDIAKKLVINVLREKLPGQGIGNEAK